MPDFGEIRQRMARVVDDTRNVRGANFRAPNEHLMYRTNNCTKYVEYVGDL